MPELPEVETIKNELLPHVKGRVITGIDKVNALSNNHVFQAGTAKVGDQIVTNGGRVVGVTAWRKNLQTAQYAAKAHGGRTQAARPQWFRAVWCS